MKYLLNIYICYIQKMNRLLFLYPNRHFSFHFFLLFFIQIDPTSGKPELQQRRRAPDGRRQRARHNGHGSRSRARNLSRRTFNTYKVHFSCNIHRITALGRLNLGKEATWLSRANFEVFKVSDIFWGKFWKSELKSNYQNKICLFKSQIHIKVSLFARIKVTTITQW